ncbi:LSU ribosomal protein L35P [Hydrogenivirga caldilitoris]|uniref:Large ribosomal subunit protein bL35 n=1 Tax=Hydrogenivirga caldilitoris TaxID=246264 RepID=A0A497XPE5_9AQUI|nr:50S ribosomal protein L35 [Hydrogenivirga caldilitoris]RLJ70010.1 LSU ribosomal protein L35P [Hydrogenivirga caldilitoris]
MAKVKMKSNRSAKKRFKVTAKGKIKRWKSGGSHYNTKKEPKRKRRLRKATYVKENMIEHVRALLRV